MGFLADGFKAGYASDNFQEVVKSGAERAYELSQSDEEPAPDNVTDEELLEMYGYEVREVSERNYEIILNSDEVGLAVAVSL